jgi:hypothetical protein
VTIDEKFTQVLNYSETHAVNGLAILIGCPSSSNKGHKPLGRVKKDLETLHTTYSQQLKFATLCLDDPSVSEIRRIVGHLRVLNKKPAWRRLVFSFSGHGDENHLYTKDGRIHFLKDVVEPLHPINAKALATIPILYFLDTCRGPEVDKGVFTSRLDQLSQYPDDVVVRGSGQWRVPSSGNFLIAYSTLPGMISYENTSGGIWTQMLATELTKSSNIDKTITEIVELVNIAVIEFCNAKHLNIQQPVAQLALTEEIKLLQEAQGTITLCCTQ